MQHIPMVKSRVDDNGVEDRNQDQSQRSHGQLEGAERAKKRKKSERADWAQ